MNWTPPFLLPRTDPESVIREIEDDPLAQIVWSQTSAASKSIRRLLAKLQPLEEREQSGEPFAAPAAQPACC
jgi:hypothetical protein